MIKTLPLLSVLASLSLMSAAQGALMTYSNSQTFSGAAAPGETKAFVIPQFDPSAGALTGVTVTVSGQFDATFKAEHLSAGNGYARAMVDSGASLSASYSTTTLSSAPINLATPNYGAGIPTGYLVMGPYDGASDYLGADTVSYTWSPVVLPGAVASYSLPADLANFTGLGLAPLSGNLTDEFVMNTLGGNNRMSLTSGAVLNITVDYTYTPVPEPASLVLLGIGAAACLVRRRRA